MSSTLRRIETPRTSSTPIESTYGFAFLKTGYDSILPEFTADLAEVGIETIHVSPLRLHPEAVDYIYRDSTHEHFYSNMRKHLCNYAVLGMILEGEEGTPTQDILDSLKSGKNGYPNLRERYQHPCDIVDDEAFAAWCRQEHEKQDEVTITLTQKNVFHAADDHEEASETLVVIHETSPEFYAMNPNTNYRRFARLVEHFDTFRYDK